MPRPRPKPLTVSVGDDQPNQLKTYFYAWFSDNPLTRAGRKGGNVTFSLRPKKLQNAPDVSKWIRAQIAAAAAYGEEDAVEEILLIIVDTAFTAGTQYQTAKLKRLAGVKAAKKAPTKKRTCKKKRTG